MCMHDGGRNDYAVMRGDSRQPEKCKCPVSTLHSPDRLLRNWLTLNSAGLAEVEG